MLSREENDLLIRTNPGTPMGRYIRHFWIPVLFSQQLPEPDCPPVRVKVLGEKLVAFRDSQGRVGLVDERCPHRNASMFFGRNEESGLRCVYHGWKFDVTGRCVDMPSEPPESNFKNKVSIEAYPCEERGEVVWAYMGEPAKMPAFPDLEWTRVPPSHRFSSRHVMECNWMQGMDGGFDASHLSFLHKGDAEGGRIVDLATEYEPIVTDFGAIMASGRKRDGGNVHWSLDLLLLPFHKLINRHGPPDAQIGTHMWVPIDDETCMIWSIEYHPHRPLTDRDLARSKKFLYIHTENNPGSDHAVINRANDYMVDRERQASGASFTGMKGLGIQDCGIQESMGPISDRTREHLGRYDRLVIHLRRILMSEVEGMEAGKPIKATVPGVHAVRSACATIHSGEPLQNAIEKIIAPVPPPLVVEKPLLATAEVH